MKPEEQYLADIQETYALLENPQDAFQMKKYMKGRFDFYGIKAPERRAASRPFLVKKNLPARERAPHIIRKLWEMPQRELHYFAIEFAEKYAKKCEPEFIELVEYLITNNSWWDTVDFIATHLASAYFKQYPEQIKPVTEKWMNSDHMWLQRSALLFQLKWKEAIDTALLFDYIRRLAHSKEFFIRKAIGWTLREYTRTDAQAVLEFLEETDLSPLSQREALKILKREGRL